MEITVRSWPKAIALVDCDSFYVSCELVLNPKLKGKPVCVLSNNDGCVVSRSKEAKALGIKMGEAAFLAKKRVPQAIYLSSNYYNYNLVSGKIMNILREFTPEVEVYSIDEAFLDLTGVRQLFKKPYIEIIKDIRKKIFNQTGIPVSIGVSLSKTLAKVAAKIAKNRGEKGIFAINGKQLRETLPTVSIESVWHIGLNTASLLKKYKINTAFDFAMQDEKWVAKILTKKGAELQQEICGYSIWEVTPQEEVVKGIQRTKSFANLINNKEVVKGALHYHLHRALVELRSKNLKAGLLTIMLRQADFQSFSLSSVISPPSNFEFDFLHKLNQMFNKIYNSKISYRSCGVYLTNLLSTHTEQLNLFNGIESISKKENLTRTWDTIENKFGKQILKTATMPSLTYLDKRMIRGMEQFSSLQNLPEVS